jgi:hypothetical protein
MLRPQDTLRQLSEIFPSFDEWWKDEQAPTEDGLVNGVYYEWRHHSVMREFLQYFASNRASFTEEQLRRVGAWINEAVSIQGDLENAVSTCFLEHTRQVKINRVLDPHLSPQAKGKSCA